MGSRDRSDALRGRHCGREHGRNRRARRRGRMDKETRPLPSRGRGTPEGGEPPLRPRASISGRRVDPCRRRPRRPLRTADRPAKLAITCTAAPLPLFFAARFSRGTWHHFASVVSCSLPAASCHLPAVLPSPGALRLALCALRPLPAASRRTRRALCAWRLAFCARCPLSCLPISLSPDLPLPRSPFRPFGTRHLSASAPPAVLRRSAPTPHRLCRFVFAASCRLPPALPSARRSAPGALRFASAASCSLPPVLPPV